MNADRWREDSRNVWRQAEALQSTERQRQKALSHQRDKQRIERGDLGRQAEMRELCIPRQDREPDWHPEAGRLGKGEVYMVGADGGSRHRPGAIRQVGPGHPNEKAAIRKCGNLRCWSNRNHGIYTACGVEPRRGAKGGDLHNSSAAWHLH